MIPSPEHWPWWASGIAGALVSIPLNWAAQATFPGARAVIYRAGEGWRSYRLRRLQRDVEIAQRYRKRPNADLALGMQASLFAIADIILLIPPVVLIPVAAKVALAKAISVGIIVACMVNGFTNIVLATFAFHRFGDPEGAEARAEARLANFLRRDSGGRNVNRDSQNSPKTLPTVGRAAR